MSKSLIYSGLKHKIYKGDRFGRLVVFTVTPKGFVRDREIGCVCDCGRISFQKVNCLIHGNSVSCGCFQREVNGNPDLKKKKHGKSKSKIYKTWQHMRKRCSPSASDHEKKYYFERGIRVCDRWEKSFKHFFEDMGTPTPGHSLDRIDNSKGYSKENCRWATKKQQARNTRANISVEFNGKKQNLADWAEELGLNYDRVYDRYRRGWAVEKVFSREIFKKKGSYL